MYNFIEYHDNHCKEATHHYKNNESQAKFAYELLEEKLFNLIRMYRNQVEEEIVIKQMILLGQQILRDKFIINLVHHLKYKEQTIQQSCGIINNLSYSLQTHLKSLCYLAFTLQEKHLLGLKHLYQKYFNCDLLQLSMVLDTRITYLVQDPSYMREHLLIKFCHRYNWNQSIFNIQYVNQYTTFYQAFNLEFVQEDNNDFVGPIPSQPYNYQLNQSPQAYQQPYGYQNSTYQQQPPINPYNTNQQTTPQYSQYGNQQYYTPSTQYPNSQINYQQNNYQPQSNYTQSNIYPQSNTYNPPSNMYGATSAYPPSPGIQPVQVPSQFSNAVSQYSNNQMVQPIEYQQNVPSFQPVLQSFTQPQINLQQQQTASTYNSTQPQINQVPYPVQQPIQQQIQQSVLINNQNSYQQYPQQIQPQIDSQQIAQNQPINQQQQQIIISNIQQNQQGQSNQQQIQLPNKLLPQDQQQQQAQYKNNAPSNMMQTVVLQPEPDMQESAIIIKPRSQQQQNERIQQQPQQFQESFKSDQTIQNKQPQEVQAAAPQQNSGYPQINVPQQDQPKQENNLKQQLLDASVVLQFQENFKSDQTIQNKQPQVVQAAAPQQNSDYPQINVPLQDQPKQNNNLKQQLLDDSVEFINEIKDKQENDSNKSDSIFIVPKQQPQIQIVDYGSVCEQLFKIRKPYINQINIQEDGLIPQIKLTQSNSIQSRQVDAPYDLDKSALSRMERRIQSLKYQKVDLSQFIKQVLIDW